MIKQLVLAIMIAVVLTGCGSSAHPVPGREVVGQSGCLACHLIGKQGNNGPGPVLTDVGSQLSRSAITHALIDSTAPMPSFQGLKQQYPIRFRALVTYLGALRNGR